MAKKTNDLYFNNFIECASLATRASELLEKYLTDFDSNAALKKSEEIHALEHQADIKKHEIVETLRRAFITPIEREDILKLAHTIDDLIDSIDDIPIHMYMNNICTIRDDALDFVRMLHKCCCAVEEVMKEFPNFKKSKIITELVIKINSYEEEADKLYHEAMRRLHTQSSNAIEILVWREIYSYFEKCCDECEHIADVVEGIIIENT